MYLNSFKQSQTLSENLKRTESLFEELNHLSNAFKQPQTLSENLKRTKKLLEKLRLVEKILDSHIERSRGPEPQNRF